MTTLKRPFATLQDTDSIINPTIPTSKKLKPNYEHPLKVIARVKPSSNDPNEPNPNETLNIDALENSITVYRPEGIPGSKEGATNQKFSFARIFDQEATQQEIMKGTISPLLDEALNNGKSALIMCHGSSIAEKAYSLIGNSSSPGMLPRIMRVLLDMKIKLMQGLSDEMIGFSSQDKENSAGNENGDQVVDFKVQFEAYEIYNEEIYDLLKENKKDKMQGGIQFKQRLQLKEKDSQRIFIKDLSTVDLSTETQAAQALARCRSHFEEDAHFINERSSTSHTILKFNIKQTFKTGVQNPLMSNRASTKHSTNSSLCFVNLAGSERPRPSDSQNKKEVFNNQSNKSLTVLSRCFRDLRELREGQNTHTMGSTWTSTSLGKAPVYKESKLTRLMYEYFSDDSNLRFITHISPDTSDLEETIRLLNYTGQLRGPQNVVSNVVNAPPKTTAPKSNNMVAAPKGILQDSTNFTNNAPMVIEEAPIKPILLQENPMNIEVAYENVTEALPEPEPVVAQPIDNLISFDQLRPLISAAAVPEVGHNENQEGQILQEEIGEESHRPPRLIIDEDLLQKPTEPTTPIKVSREDFPVLITYPEIDTKKALPKKNVTPNKPRGVTPNKNPLTPNRNPLTPNRTPLTPNRNPLTPNRNPLTPNRVPLAQALAQNNQNKPVLVEKKKEVVMPKISAWQPLANEKPVLVEKEKSKSSKKKVLGTRSKPGTAAKENQALTLDEKDVKIQVLEDLVQKLQEKVFAKQTAEKLDAINEGFKSTFKTLMDVNTNTTKPPGEDIPFLANAIGLEGFGPEEKQRESLESSTSIESIKPEGAGSTIPINVNYFVFNGEIKNENIQKLEKFFKANNKNTVNQNQLFVFEQKDGGAMSSCTKDSVAKTDRDLLLKQEVIEISDDEEPKVKVEEGEFIQSFNQRPQAKKRTAQKEHKEREESVRLEDSSKKVVQVSAEKTRRTPTTKMEVEGRRSSVSKSRERNQESDSKSPNTATRSRRAAIKDSPGLTPIATRTRRRTKGKNE